MLHAPRRRSFVDLPTLSGLVIATALIVGGAPACADRAPVTIGGPFILTAPDGTTVTDQTYRGKWLLLFFGYTSCPDLCPTTLNEFAQVLAALGSGAQRLQPIFITVDPERDTPDVMGKYTAAFDRRIIGLTGSPKQIAEVSESYGAYSVQRKIGAGDYVVDHSSYIYIMNPRGQFVRGLEYDTPSGRIADILRQLMTQSGE